MRDAISPTEARNFVDQHLFDLSTGRKLFGTLEPITVIAPGGSGNAIFLADLHDVVTFRPCVVP
jgi:hypothetical protein